MNLNKDVNCNDIIRMSITVNGKEVYFLAHCCNTKKDFYSFQTEAMTSIEQMNLVTLSRTGASR